jgi:rhodanese-related sulfurtransferase
MNYIVFILNIVFLFQQLSIQQDNTKCFVNINSDDFNLLIETEEVVLIDVRTLSEYRKERIPNTLFAPEASDLLRIIQTLDSTAVVLLYCKEGDRSIQAAEIICSKSEIKRIYNLEKGLDDWIKQGYPIDKSRIKRKRN